MPKEIKYPWIEYKRKAEVLIWCAVKELYDIDLKEIDVKESPKDIDSDFSFPCYALARQVGKKPEEVVKEVTE